MPAIFLLLIKSNLRVLQCSWAILDFVSIAGYTFYTKETLRYFSHALMQINKTKNVFKDIYCSDVQIQDNELGHFNFPKWYVMTHYPESIRLFRSIVRYTTRIREAWHIT